MEHETKKKILIQRAEKLAKEYVTIEKKNDIHITAFQLEHERYAIESIYIREVYPFKDFTPLPGLPSFVLGIINLRRKILSLIDLKILFDIPKGNNGQSVVIVMENQDMEFAILADKVEEVLSLSILDIQPPPLTLTGMKLTFLKGVTADGLIVLDGNKLLKDKSLLKV